LKLYDGAGRDNRGGGRILQNKSENPGPL